jgi:hypothetical protein
VRVDADRVPADGAWRLFGVSDTDDPNPLTLRAMILLGSPMEPDRDVAAGADPLMLARAGFLAGAWDASLVLGWSDARLKAMLALIFCKMGDLVESFFDADPARTSARSTFPYDWLGLAVTQEIVPRYQALHQELMGLLVRNDTPPGPQESGT